MLELMIPPERMRDAGAYVEWLRLAVHEKTLSGSNRTRAAGSCFAIAQDHHHAIVLLVDHRLFASAFSLLRSAFDAYVRGLWLAHCATDEQIGKYLKDGSPPKIDTLLAAVEKMPGFSEQVLSRVKAKNWGAMCAYTHSGGLHLQRWNTSDGIEPNYSLEEVLDVLTFAEFIGVMSVLGIAELATDEELALRLLNKVKERAGK
jgi:hypothetical protein